MFGGKGMKRFASLLLCATFLLLPGCGQSNGGDAKSSKNPSSSHALNSSSNSSSSELVKIATIQEAKKLDINYKINDLKALFNGNLVFDTSKQSGDQAADDTIYSYDVKSMKAEQIGIVKSEHTDSGDFVVMKNNSCLYYCPFLMDSKGNNALVKADFTNKKVIYEQRYDLDPPYVNFYKINETEFLMKESLTTMGKAEDGSQNTWDVLIKKYNVDTRKETLLFKNHFEKKTNTGTLMASACLKDNLIYSYSIKGTAGKTENVIEVYDLNGKLQKTMQIPQLESILKANKDDSVFTIKTFGNYFYFNTSNGLAIFYEYTDSGLKKVDFKSYPYLNIIEPSNITNDIAHNRSIYFLETNKNSENAIGILDSSTGEFKSVKINVDGFQYICKAVVDEKGNIVADMCNQKVTSSKLPEYRYYYIESEKLLNAQ